MARRTYINIGILTVASYCLFSLQLGERMKIKERNITRGTKNGGDKHFEQQLQWKGNRGIRGNMKI